MKINLRESLNELDMLSDNRYDLYNTYLSKNPSLDTKKKLSEAIYNNKSPKEILMILNEDWDDEELEWEEMNSKLVRDSDGFLTDYTWYRNNETGQNVFVFGDKDLYRPEDGYFDWECDTDMEGFEWFKNYVGPGDEDGDWMDESLNEAKFIETKYRDGDVVFVGDANGYHGSFLIEGDIKNIPEELYKHIRKITKYGNLDEPYYKVEYKLDSNHLFEEDYRKFFEYIIPVLKNAGITIIDEDELNKPKNSFKWESLKEDASKETIKWKITYGKGRPDGEEEVVEFPTYKEAKQYAADHAKGWGFEVKKLEESLKEDTKERILHISKKEEPELRDRNSVWIQVKDENDIEKYFKTALRMAPDKIVIHDFDIDEIPKKLLALSKSAEIPVSFDESLDEAMVRVEPTEKELNQVINVLTKYGFKLDDNYKPGRGLFGSYHIQVINPDLTYIDDDQFVKDVEPVGDALDTLSFDINMPITYNFGANEDGVVTAGVDIHVGYKDDDIDESLKEDLNIDDFMEPVDQVGKAKIYYDSNKRTYFTPSLDLDFDTLDQAKDFIGAPLYTGESLKEDFIISPEKEYTSESLSEGLDPWYGKYVPMMIGGSKGEPRKVYFYFDSTDFEEAEEEFLDIIPEPYVKAKLYGRASESSLVKDGWKNINESLNEASYGGAFDIEDDMYFTSEDIVEFGDTIAIDFSKEVGRQFDLSDAYMTTPTQLHLEFTDNDFDYVADIKIDMRKIRVPSDIYKYKNEVLKQLREQISNEDSY